MDLWCEVLDVEDSDTTKNPHFCDLRDDCVATIRLVGAANDRRIALSNSIVFEHPELEIMASFCRETEKLEARAAGSSDRLSAG